MRYIIAGLISAVTNACWTSYVFAAFSLIGLIFGIERLHHYAIAATATTMLVVGVVAMIHELLSNSWAIEADTKGQWFVTSVFKIGGTLSCFLVLSQFPELNDVAAWRILVVTYTSSWLVRQILLPLSHKYDVERFHRACERIPEILKDIREADYEESFKTECVIALVDRFQCAVILMLGGKSINQATAGAQFAVLKLSAGHGELKSKEAMREDYKMTIHAFLELIGNTQRSFSI